MREHSFVGGSIGLAFAVMACVTATSLPERKAYLSPHQDSWKSFHQPYMFVLRQRSFEHDPFFGWDGQCVHGIVRELDFERKRAVADVFYWDNASGQMINQTSYLHTEATEGYSVPNALAASLFSDSPLSVYYPLVVSEYDNCDIDRAPHRNNGCDLWVTLEGLRNISSICLFIYDLLCGPNKFITTEF
ncbi:uncharacterized protein LOC144124178 [Amblyomma americanum]